MTVIIAILAFIVAISILVAVHEFGHFWVARRLGFKVLRFSIGFGKPLWVRHGKDGVEYAISSLPIGGYVKMLDEREGPVAPEELHRSFTRRPVWQRVAVLLAGPTFNFIFAVFAYWLLFMWGNIQVRPVVEGVIAGSYAADAGMKDGDEIVAVDGHRTPSTQAVIFELIKRVPDADGLTLTVRGDQGKDSERSLYLRLDDADARHRMTEPGQLLSGLGFDYWTPTQPVVVSNVVPGTPAAAAGLKAGDRIVSVDGAPVRNFAALVRAVGPRPGETVTVNVERDGAPLDVSLTVGRGKNPRGQTVGQIGVEGRALPMDRSEIEGMLILRKFGPIEALPQAASETWATAELTVQMLWSMVVGKVSVKNISGPINIAAFAGETARIGVKQFLTFLAIVSISLGILNLMPIPLLDGGQIVYQLIEGFKGSPLSERAQALGQQVGIAALVLLMGLAFYNDISSRFFN